MHAQTTISILCLARTPNAMLNKTQIAPLDLPNSTWYLEVTTITLPDVEKCTTSLEADVSCILTSRRVHPAGSGFAESGSVVVVPASHTFSLAAFDPFIVDVAVDALEVQSQRPQSTQVASVYLVRVLRWARCTFERVLGGDTVCEVNNPDLDL